MDRADRHVLTHAPVHTLPGGPEARRPGGPEARRPGGPEARRPGGPEARRRWAACFAATLQVEDQQGARWVLGSIAPGCRVGRILGLGVVSGVAGGRFGALETSL